MAAAILAFALVVSALSLVVLGVIVRAFVHWRRDYTAQCTARARAWGMERLPGETNSELMLRLSERTGIFR